jgi:putative hydrolase of the HAD superfamily
MPKSPKNMDLKTIFFDVYQTLVSVGYDGNEKAWDIFPKFLNRKGVLIDSDQFQNLLDQEKQKYYTSVKDPEMKLRHHNFFDLINAIFQNYNVEIGKEELLDLIWQFRQAHHPETKLYPGVKDMLHELSLKYMLAVASYTQGSYMLKELEKLGIAQYFSHFIFSSDIGYRKTDQEFYKICLQKTNGKPDECLMVGDNYLQDVVTPKKLGLKAILIRNPLTDGENIIGNVKPDRTVELENISTLPLIMQGN